MSVTPILNVQSICPTGSDVIDTDSRVPPLLFFLLLRSRGRLRADHLHPNAQGGLPDRTPRKNYFRIRKRLWREDRHPGSQIEELRNPHPSVRQGGERPSRPAASSHFFPRPYVLLTYLGGINPRHSFQTHHGFVRFQQLFQWGKYQVVVRIVASGLRLAVSHSVRDCICPRFGKILKVMPPSWRASPPRR